MLLRVYAQYNPRLSDMETPTGVMQQIPQTLISPAFLRFLMLVTGALYRLVLQRRHAHGLELNYICIARGARIF